MDRMWRIRANLLVVGFLVLYVLHETGGQGICYQRTSTSIPVVTYSRSSYINTYTCGWNGWSRCTRTQYRQVSILTTRTVYSSIFGCCTGYVQAGNTCNPTCSGNCNDRGTCASPNQCNCNSGWTGNDCGTDVNECSSSGSNMCQHVCVNTPGSYNCSCNSGYRLNSDGTCAEIHECNEMTDNCEQVCNNNDGSFYCSCNSGYSLSTNGYSCLNDDECTLDTDRCEQVCHDTQGAYTCSCHVGYVLQSDGYSCNDINECASGGAATCAQNCHNTNGSYTCSCDTGYTLNNNERSCDDINECSTNNGGCEHTCTNMLGSFNCSCNSGYSLGSDQRSCSDIDECTSGSDICDQNCINTMGSYTCSCNAGYLLDSDGHTCNDVNECADSTTNQCAQVCTNTEGSYTCSCRVGYVLGSDSYSCSDVNECSTSNGGCSQVCENIAGSFRCSCNTGYILGSDQRTCFDIPECESSSVPCTQNCVETSGSYRCSCISGFVLEEDGFTCTDINECTLGTCRCTQLCNNTLGSYSCSCNPGYILDSNGYNCIDVNECGGVHGCEQVCNNTAGSFQCACLPGYVLASNGLSCQDVDECSSDLNQCEQTCMNTVGSYLCSCGMGYTLNSDGHRCIDVNECAPGGVGNTTCTETCLNSPGSWQCGCFIGRNLSSNGVSCQGINECAEGLHQCDQFCTDTENSYTCSCNSSTVLNADGFHCDDINECTSGMHNCTIRCYNTYGSFYCGCNPGYTLNADGVTCEDQNECEDGMNPCEQTCNNTAGSYTCGCTTGFSLTSDGTSCLGPPQSIMFSQVTSSRFYVSWTAPMNDSRDGEIRSYTLSCTSRQDRIYYLRTDRGLTDTNREYHVRELQPFTDYTCCVSVRTTTGVSPDLCSTQRTAEEEPGTPPEIVMITSEDPNSVSLTVNPPVRPNGVITAYTLYVYFDNESSVVVVDRTLTGMLSIGDLYPYQRIAVRVSANTSVGEGPRSAFDEIRTQQSAPLAVTRVAVEVMSNSSITVRWNPPLRANGILLNYTIRVYNRLNNFSEEFNVSRTARRITTLQNLSPYIPYTVEVSALTVVGSGPVTTDVVFTEHGVPNIPILTNAIRINEEQAKITWIPLTPDEARGVLTNLRIIYAPTTNGTCFSSIHEEGMQQMDIVEEIDVQKEAIINELMPTEQYCVAIKVSTVAGESGFSQVLILSLPSDVFVQIRLALGESTTCQEYLVDNNEQKVLDISSAIVEQLLLQCRCPYSLDHITNASLHCGANTHEVIYQSNLLSSRDTLASDLQSMVQGWVDTNPGLLVGGVMQSVDSYCQVSLSALGETEECVALHPTTVKDQEGTEQDGNVAVAPIIGVVVGGVLLFILLLSLTGIVCFCLTNKRSKLFSTSSQDEDMYEELAAMGTKSHNVAYGVRNFVDYTPADYDKAAPMVPADYEVSLKTTKDDSDDYEKMYHHRKFSPADFEVSQKFPTEQDNSQKSGGHKESPANYEVSLNSSQPNDYEKMYGLKNVLPPPPPPPPRSVPADYEVSLNEYEKMYGPKKVVPGSQTALGNRPPSFSKYIPPDYEESRKPHEQVLDVYEDMDSSDKKSLIGKKDDQNKDIKEHVVGDNIYTRIDEYQDSDEEIYESMI